MFLLRICIMPHGTFSVILTRTANVIVPRITLHGYKRIPVVYGIGVKFVRSRMAASNYKYFLNIIKTFENFNSLSSILMSLSRITDTWPIKYKIYFLYRLKNDMMYHWYNYNNSYKTISVRVAVPLVEIFYIRCCWNASKYTNSLIT